MTGPVPSTVQWLRALGADELETLLRLRPDLAAEPRPRDLGDLASRVDDSWSVVEVLHAATLPCLQVAEALQALTGRARRDDLVGLLGAGDTADADAVDDALGWLTLRGVVRAGGTDVEASPALRQCYPEPLGLGASSAELVPAQTVPALGKILGALGRPTPKVGGKAALVAAVTVALADRDLVRAVAATASPLVAEWLLRHACGTADPADDGTPGRYDPSAYRTEREATEWALTHGLLLSLDYGYQRTMPAEVAMALRGEAFRAPFTPRRPPVATRHIAAADVARESAAAATSFAAHSVSVLDHVARAGVPTLKSGGVGARELTRLVKETGAGADEVRLTLELAEMCELVEDDSRRVVTGDGFDSWRSSEPAQRYAVMLRTWWGMGGVATEARDRDGKAVPALRQQQDCAACAAGRQVLLLTLGELPPDAGSGLAAVGPAAAWARPLVHAGGSADHPFRTTWREAELLGVVARGALTDLGRRLVASDPAGLALVATAMLPGTSDEAAFGPDLTVMVVGAPSSRVSALLDACADRESRGGAVVWRITEQSMRRAMDDGVTGEELERDLAAVARDGLPQPLLYLVRDVARRHGSVRVRGVASCLRSDDEALLAELAVDRRLKRLKLQRLAPTVVVSEVGHAEVVDLLRTHGYMPVPEDGAGVVRVVARRPRGSGESASAGAARAATPARAARPAPVDVREVATELVRAGVPEHSPPTSVTERTVAKLAPRLPSAQSRLLAHAIDEGADVVIEYVASTGGRTTRQIRQPVLLGSGLLAFCELRQDERNFTVSRILSVRPAG